MKRILLIEDNQELSLYKQRLLSADYELVPAFAGSAGLNLAQLQAFDLILLASNLAAEAEVDVLSGLRGLTAAPIVLLTDASGEALISGYLKRGADSYILRPFESQAFTKQIEALLSQTVRTSPCPKVSSYKNIQLDEAQSQISAGTNVAQLSKKEFQIFTLLLEQPQKTFSKAELYEHIWGEAYLGNENTINVHLSNLRKKLQQLDPETSYIETVWSLGVTLAQ